MIKKATLFLPSCTIQEKALTFENSDCQGVHTVPVMLSTVPAKILNPSLILAEYLTAWILDWSKICPVQRGYNLI